MKHSIFAAAFFLIGGTLSLAIGQQHQENPGFKLYGQGKYADAIKVLDSAVKVKENKKNAEMWNTLGLAYFATGDIKKATKSLSRAVSLGPAVAAYRGNLAHIHLAAGNYGKAEDEAERAIGLDARQAHPYYIRGAAHLAKLQLQKAQEDADRVHSLDPNYVPGYLLASDINLATLSQKLSKSEDGEEGTATARENVGILKRSAEILSDGLSRSASGPDKDRLEKELAGINAFVEHFSREPRPPGQPAVTDPSVTPLKILSKPKAVYTDSARNNNVQGTIRLSILLGASGKVEGIILLKRLGYGLDQQAIAAATQVRFEPKMKDGKPVSTVVTFDYGFNIY